MEPYTPAMMLADLVFEARARREWPEERHDHEAMIQDLIARLNSAGIPPADIRAAIQRGNA